MIELHYLDYDWLVSALSEYEPDWRRFVHSIDLDGHVHLVATDGYRIHALREPGSKEGQSYMPGGEYLPNMLVPVDGEWMEKTPPLGEIQAVWPTEFDRTGILDTSMFRVLPDDESLTPFTVPIWFRDGEVEHGGLWISGYTRREPTDMFVSPQYMGDALANIRNGVKSLEVSMAIGGNGPMLYMHERNRRAVIMGMRHPGDTPDA